MNTAIPQHSALESFLLFRGIELHGLDPAAFARISDALQNNFLVRNNSNYDATRLRPESLQQLFLSLLWEELKSESDNFVRPDDDLSELSPASKKRKLQPPPPPTLREARHHVSKIEAIYLKLQDLYIRSAIKDIRELESDFDQVNEEIRILEDVNRVNNVNNVSPAPAQPTKTPNGVGQDYAVKRDLGHVNGTGAATTPKPSPQPPTQISPPVPPPIPASIPTPAPQAAPPTQVLTDAVRWQPTRNGSLPVTPLQAPVGGTSASPVATPVTTQGPTPAQAPAQAPGPVLAPAVVSMTPSSSAVAQILSPAPAPTPAPPASIPATSAAPIPTAPALAQAPAPAPAPVPVTASSLGHTVPAPSLPHPGPSPRLGQQPLPRPQPAQPVPSQETPKAPNGTPQVLQPPRGIPFQSPAQQFNPPPIADGLQRPEHVPRPKQPPVTLPPVTQQDAQAGYKWEPVYKVNPNSPMHAMPQQQQQQPQHIHHSQSPIPTTQPSQSTQLPQILQSQRPPRTPQHILHPAPRPLQPQISKPVQQQVLSPAPQTVGHAQYQATQPPQPPAQHYQHPQHQQHPPQPQLAPQLSQHLPPSHLAQIRPAPEVQGFQSQQRPPYTHAGQGRVTQPPQHPHPSYQNYTPSGVRSPVNHSPLPSPTGLHPRASQLAPPQPHQQQQTAPQPQVHQPGPPPFPQRKPPSGPPSPALPLGDGQRAYNSPYHQQQPQLPNPRAFVPDRLQQNRPPVVTTPRQQGPVFAPIHSAPHTPAPSFLPWLTKTGSGTAWSKNLTPSTPKSGSDWRFNETESPAPEPLSPVLKKSALPSVAPRDEPKGEQPAPERPSQPQTPLAPVETPNAKRKPGRPRGSQKAHDETPSAVVPNKPLEKSPGRPRDKALEGPSANTSREPSEEPPQQRSNQQKSPAKGAPKLNVDLEVTKIKDEVTTPNHTTDAWDTPADESVAARRQAKRQTKRKRDDMSPTPAPTPPAPTPIEGQGPVVPEADTIPETDDIPEEDGSEPNTVVWTRSFHKVSASAMEQIVRHRLANMFAVPIRERDAPGYHKRILQPQDLKSIRAAITTGNRVAAQAAAALPGGDPGTSTVRLPISEDLIPPKAIINSNQLDRELAHMFANAIMYNPDHGHGPGPAFLVQEDDEINLLDGPDEDQGNAAANQSSHHGQQDHILGYKVDEYGVVHDTRAMFQDVDKWLSELRSAEIERGAKPTATGTSTRQASVAGGYQGDQSFSSNTATGAADTTMDDADDQTATEPETAVVKRRRITRNA